MLIRIPPFILQMIQMAKNRSNMTLPGGHSATVYGPHPPYTKRSELVGSHFPGPLLCPVCPQSVGAAPLKRSELVEGAGIARL